MCSRIAEPSSASQISGTYAPISRLCWSERLDCVRSPDCDYPRPARLTSSSVSGWGGVGFGSAYYHYAPSTPTLVWDRLPMTVAFMALFAMVVRDRISESCGRVLLWPLVLAGVTSVGYWHWSEFHGRGDLRAYAVIEFLPMLLMPLLRILSTGAGL